LQIFAGTSGFSYAEWCGRFYPEALPGDRMLGFYAGRLPTVEINNTFYRMPKQETVLAWGAEVPEAFQFAVKASRRITHSRKLADVGDDVAYLFDIVGALGAKLGPVLFQLPPFLKKDLGLLDSFLAVLPEGRRAALEFRHPSWFSDDVYSALAARNVALVGGDLEEAEKSPPLVATADFGYLRLRRLDYDPAGIAEWGERVAEQSWGAVYAYLKHEILGPLFAESLLAVLTGTAQPDLSAVRASIAAPKPKSTRGSASKTKSGAPKSAKAASKSSETPSARTSKAPKSGAAKGPKPPSKAPASAAAKPRKA